MARLFLLCVILTEYPYSLTPGGVKADYYASHDFPAWVDMRFAGEVYWVHTTIRKGEGLTNDGRRARCGNHFRTELPPGAEKLPPEFKFLVPILESPLPGLNDGPPAISLTPPFAGPPLLTPNAPLGAPVMIGPLPILPVLIPTCDEHKDNKCKKKPGPVVTPEPSAWLLVAIGLLAAVIKLGVAHVNARKRRFLPLIDD